MVKYRIRHFPSNDDQKLTTFPWQSKIKAMAVQRGNVQCVQGAYGEPAFEELDEIFYIVKPNNIF